MLFLLVGYTHGPLSSHNWGRANIGGWARGLNVIGCRRPLNLYMYIFAIGSGPVARVEGGVRADQVTLIEATIMT